MPINFIRPSAAFTGHKWALALSRELTPNDEGIEEYHYPIIAKAFPTTTAGVIAHDDSHADNIFTAYPTTDAYDDLYYHNIPYSGGTSGCSATVVFHSGTFSSSPGGTITLTDSKGEAVTYTATSGAPSGVNGEFLCSGPAASAVAENFKTLINSASGHAGSITATRSGGSVLLVQNGMNAPLAAYASGNTSITYSAFSGMLSGTAPTQFSGCVDSVSAGSTSGFSVIRLTDGYGTIEQAVSALKIKVVDVPPSSVAYASAGEAGVFDGSANFGTGKYVDISGMRSDWSAVSGTAIAAHQRVYFTVPLSYSLNTAFSAISQVSATALLGRSNIALGRQRTGGNIGATYEPPPATAQMAMCCCKYTSVNKFQMWVLMAISGKDGTRNIRIRGSMSRDVSKNETCIMDSDNPKCGDDICDAKSTINYYSGGHKGGKQNAPCAGGASKMGKGFSDSEASEDGEVLLTGGQLNNGDLKGGDFGGWKGGDHEKGASMAICIRYHLNKEIWNRTNYDMKANNCSSDCPSGTSAGNVASSFNYDFTINEKGSGAQKANHPNRLVNDLLGGMAAGAAPSVSGSAAGDLTGKGWSWNGDDTVNYHSDSSDSNYVAPGSPDEGKTWDDLPYPKAANEGGGDVGWFTKGTNGRILPCLSGKRGSAAKQNKYAGNSTDNPLNPPPDMFSDSADEWGYQEVNTWESGGNNTKHESPEAGGTKDKQGRLNNSVNERGAELAEYMLANAEGFSDLDLGVSGTKGSKRGSNACKAAVTCTMDITKKTM